MVKKAVKLKSGFIEFKNHFRQIRAPFKIYADFECILKSVKSNRKTNDSYTEYQNIKITFVPVVLTNLFVLIINLASQLFFTGVKFAAYNFIKMMLKEFGCCKKVMKKHFNKNLVITEKEENFWSSNSWWICGKLIDDEEIRDHCHTTGKYGVVM